jgi:chemotaxis-related protein WspD
VDEVHGIYRYDPRALRDVPATLAKAEHRYATGIVAWREQALSCLDGGMVFSAIAAAMS